MAVAKGPMGSKQLSTPNGGAMSPLEDRWKNVESGFRAWVERIIQTEKPPESIVAFNFGIFETADGYSLYLVGADHYTENNDDWAADEKYSPSDRYFVLPGKWKKGKEWKSVMTRMAQIVTSYLATPTAKSSFFDKATAITVGFDDGDLTRVK